MKYAVGISLCFIGGLLYGYFSSIEAPPIVFYMTGLTIGWLICFSADIKD